jgi:hypothetical protein
MSAYIANNIMTVFDTQGLTAAQDRYRAWFINTLVYARYKADTDTILITSGYSLCIVTA